MKIKLLTIFILFICFIGIVTINSCTKEKGAIATDEATDAKLFDLAKETTGFNWFKNSNVLLNKSSGTGHPQPFLRTRYNSIASSKLDSDGKIVTGAIFPEGSLIVKELYDNAATLGRYAILYKKPGSVNADSKGWVWGYINSNGSVAAVASQKGASCVSCHSQSDNIDYMLMGKYFP